MSYRLDSDLFDPPGRLVRWKDEQPTADHERHRENRTKHDMHHAHFVHHDQGSAFVYCLQAWTKNWNELSLTFVN